MATDPVRLRNHTRTPRPRLARDSKRPPTPSGYSTPAWRIVARPSVPASTRHWPAAPARKGRDVSQRPRVKYRHSTSGATSDPAMTLVGHGLRPARAAGEVDASQRLVDMHFSFPSGLRVDSSPIIEPIGQVAGLLHLE